MTAEIILTGDFETDVTNKYQWLNECTKALTDFQVQCINVRNGSIIVKLASIEQSFMDGAIERIEEIARMLSDNKVTSEARNAAIKLLEN